MVHLNVYPNAFFKTDPGVGFFTIVGTDGRYELGVSFTRSLGFGIGGGTM